VPPQIGIGQRGPPGYSRERQRRDELRRRFGEEAIDLRAGLRQLAGEVGHFVSGDAAAHAEDEAFVLKERYDFHRN
jgi:hypothetical protein